MRERALQKQEHGGFQEGVLTLQQCGSKAKSHHLLLEQSCLRGRARCEGVTSWSHQHGFPHVDAASARLHQSSTTSIHGTAMHQRTLGNRPSPAIWLQQQRGCSLGVALARELVKTSRIVYVSDVFTWCFEHSLRIRFPMLFD